MSNPSEILRPQLDLIGRYNVRGGKVVEWEFDNAADERPDGVYTLYAGNYPDHFGLTPRALEGRPSLEPSADSLHKLLELCDISDESHYSTLSVSTVRGLVQDALSHPTERSGKAMQRPAGYETLALLDWERLGSSYRALDPEHQWAFDALRAAETQRSSNATRSDEQPEPLEETDKDIWGESGVGVVQPPAPEPVAYINPMELRVLREGHRAMVDPQHYPRGIGDTPLYLAPPAREQRGAALTDIRPLPKGVAETMLRAGEELCLYSEVRCALALSPEDARDG